MTDDTSYLPRTAPNDATVHTRAITSQSVPPFDPADFERAERGLVAQHPTGIIQGDFGEAWNINKYDFIQRGSTNPDTVHPSLWRQAQLNNIHGLFEVAPGVWQARSYDISNITFIAGDTGWVIIDPLTSTATARDCLALANEHLGERPVTAVIYTHSHLDHFGGVLGVTTQADVDAGRCRIIAPEHFMREAVAENLLAGHAMNRRALYQFGPLLPAGPKGHVDCGLGKGTPLSMPGLIVPTEDITYTGEELVVDGIRIVFQLTPETEAPAEMNFFFPDKGWLCMAENCSHNMHNLIPIRGAQCRDSLAWSTYIDDAIELFADGTEIMFASHHWPRFGNERIREVLRDQRDLYAHMNNQVLHLANQGVTINQIHNIYSLPPSLQQKWHCRGYHGSPEHNARGVIQRYLGFWDCNPATLIPLSPADSAPLYVEMMGGSDKIIARGRQLHDEGSYLLASEIVNKLVQAEPRNEPARELLADIFEQLGYQQENPGLRNSFLSGAYELRSGIPEGETASSSSPDVVRAMSTELFLNFLAIKMDSRKVEGLRFTINLVTPDNGEKFVVELENATLTNISGFQAEKADLTLTINRADLELTMMGAKTLEAQLKDGTAKAEGDVSILGKLAAAMVEFDPRFEVMPGSKPGKDETLAANAFGADVGRTVVE